MSKKKRFSKSQISVIRMTGITKIVTWQNFRDYFGADGRLLETVDDSALLFQGKFDGNELNIHRITIDRPVSFIGDIKVLEAVFKDIAIDIVSSDVTIDGLVLKAMVPLGDLISVRRSGVSINNMRIEYRCGDESSTVINVSCE